MFRACASGEYTSFSQESLNHALVMKASFRVQECFYCIVVNTLEELQAHACSECKRLLASRMLTLALNIQAFALETFQTGLVTNLQAYPIKRVFSDMRLWKKQVLRFKHLLKIQCGKKKCSKQSLVVDTHTSLLVMNTRAFPSRECFVHAHVVKHKLSFS